MPTRVAAPPKASGNLIICDKSYAIDWPVVNYYDNARFSAYFKGCYKGKNGPPTSPYPFAPAKGLGLMLQRYRERRLMGGGKDIKRLAEIIHQFVVHHDGCGSSEDCFHVLHDERGLSVHFLIDNDGTIYQTLDLGDGAFHATGVNEISVGVELCNRGEVKLDGPEFYSRRGMSRDVVDIQIHNSRYHMWAYTEAQYGAMFALGKALARLFPNLPQVYPESNSDLVRTSITEPRNFAGYVGHYHVTNQKWDPGAFDFKRMMQKIKSRAVWFMCLGRGECEKPQEILDDEQKAEEQAMELVRNNEEDAMGGYYPVGPFGRTRLWHGGLHVSTIEQAPVFCPFPGKIVAARNGDDAPIGSVNFVLTRHSFQLGDQAITFFLLFYHLDREDPDKQRTPWFSGADKKPFWQGIKSDEVAFPDIEVQSGEVIGHAGQAGPPGNFEPQVHIEVLSAEELGAKLEPGFWRTLDAGRSGHFCDAKEVLDLIDRPKGHGDGLLSEQELRDFFAHDEQRAELRKLAVRFQSEWGAARDYEQQLLRSKDFAKLPKAARTRTFREQIEPTLWYTEAVAEKTGLPGDFIVWHYHAVRFVAWMNMQLKKQGTTQVQVTVSSGPAAASVGDDRESLEGYTDDEDETSLEAGKKLTLEDLANGYPDEAKR